MRHQQTDELYVPYREYRVANTLVGRPVIIAEIRSQDAWGFYPMLLDTGADEIVLPAKLMEPLGIEQSDCVNAGLAMTPYGAADRLMLAKLRFEFEELWPAWGFEAPVVFSTFADQLSYGLLGREPTLEHLRCQFGHADGYGFWISRV